MTPSKYLKLVLTCVLISIVHSGIAQNSSISGVVKGLKQGDTATIKIQKSAEAFYFKRVGGIANNADVS